MQFRRLHFVAQAKLPIAQDLIQVVIEADARTNDAISITALDSAAEPARMKTRFQVAKRLSGGAAVAEPFLGEIRIFSFNYAPTTQGWTQCNGQLLPINQNQALFSLLGTTYGGDGQTNFALPDLRGRVPIMVGSGHTQGERGGEQAHTLSISRAADAHARAQRNVGDRQQPCS